MMMSYDNPNDAEHALERQTALVKGKGSMSFYETLSFVDSVDYPTIFKSPAGTMAVRNAYLDGIIMALDALGYDPEWTHGFLEGMLMGTYLLKGI